MTHSLEAISASSASTVGPGDDFVSFGFIDNGSPQADVSSWISTDAAGAVVIAGTLVSDGAGRVTFLLTAGATYYLWAEKAGKVSIQGRLFVAVAD